ERADRSITNRERHDVERPSAELTPDSDRIQVLLRPAQPLVIDMLDELRATSAQHIHDWRRRVQRRREVGNEPVDHSLASFIARAADPPNYCVVEDIDEAGVAEHRDGRLADRVEYCLVME